MNTFWTILVPLLDEPPDPADVAPGLLGFVVFVALALAVTFLAFSLRKHLRKVDFEEKNGPDDSTTPAPDGPDRPV